MATFTPEEIEFIKTRGNDYCRRLWLGLYEGESVNFADEQSVRDFMSDKYEKKRYYLESQSNNSTITNGGSIKNKSKSKIGSNSSGPPLISLPTPPPRPTANSMSNRSKIGNNLLPVTSQPVKSGNQNSSKIDNNFVQPFVNSNVNHTPVPE